MNPRILELEQRLAESRRVLREAVESVAAELHSVKPSPERWSVNDVLEHLALIDARIAQVLSDGLAQAKADGVGPDSESSPVLPGIDWSSVLDRSRRVEARATAVPTRGLTSIEAWQELEAARRHLVDVMRQGDDVDMSAIHFPHPLFGALNGYAWCAFIAAHEERHAAQIREIAADLGAAPAA